MKKNDCVQQCRSLVLALLLQVMLFAPAFSSSPPSLLYSRASVEVERMRSAGGPSAPLALDTEIRDAASAERMPGWFNFISPGEQHAALLIYPEPQIVTLSRSNDFAAMDVLFIDEYGTITQIAPGLVLAQLQEPITTANPVLALMYLRGGMCEKLGIQPGDRAHYGIFKKKPAVLTAPATSTAPTPSALPPVEKRDDRSGLPF